jgi:hypothetical protein
MEFSIYILTRKVDYLDILVSRRSQASVRDSTSHHSRSIAKLIMRGRKPVKPSIYSTLILYCSVRQV